MHFHIFLLSSVSRIKAGILHYELVTLRAEIDCSARDYVYVLLLADCAARGSYCLADRI